MERRPKTEYFDVVVVGSGASGSVVAARAAEAGKRVLILESGPERRLKDLKSSQIWARRLKWNGAPVSEEGNLKVSHGFNAADGTGGAAVHHYGVWPRLHPNDFDVASTHGRSLDWPIDYDDLRPWYDEIQAEVGISGDAKAERWRPPGSPYPMPPLPVFRQGQIIAEGFRKQGLNTAPIPLAVNSQPFAGRDPCIFDGWCDAGCPIGALVNPLVVYLPKAFAAGAQIRHNATVTRLVTEEGKSRLAGVEYVDAERIRHEIHADKVVLAAFVVQNARLLLASASRRYPDGVGNQYDQVGRYLMTHPSVYMFGMFAQETQPAVGATGGQIICQDAYDEKDKGEAFGSYQWLAGQAVKPNDLLGYANSRPDIFGAALEPFMQRASRHFGSMVCVGEDVAQKDNRVTLGESKDVNGVPLAHTVHNVAPESSALLAGAVEEGKAVFKAAGADEAWSAAPFGMHIMGGTVMGEKPANSVTDAFGRCHGVDNLYIAGPGLFPTSGAVNPTFTVHALAARTAATLLND